MRQVKSDAMKMKTKIREGDTVIQDTGGHLLKTGMELKQAHSVQYNIYATMESLNNCIPGLLSGLEHLCDVMFWEHCRHV